ncbi:MAG TPA: sigma 54-interacting transcriptional regulator [Candidatus Aquilonibacter sp.]|nr:sigma 54-interacting transcriptional regulator [Candidatus Aquilonibacter sp.]
MNPSAHTLSLTSLHTFPSAQAPAERPFERENAQRLIGPSPAMARLWAQIRLLAPHFRIALLTGEAGTAADAVAQALHDLSPFSGTPLVHVRAAEADRQLRQPSTLFGNSTRGALFVTDVERLSNASQQMLLRFLKLRRHRRIAVIGFTAVDLRPLVSSGAFNAELFAHLGSLRLQLPALRERVQDIPLLAHQYLQIEAARLGRPVPSLEQSFLSAATDYTWPGNLDQLRSAIAWLMENCDRPVLVAADLHMAISAARVEPQAQEATVRMVPLDHVVQEHVRAVLIGCNGNKLRAAEVLGISRSTLYRMLEATAAGSSGDSLALAS